MTARGDSPDAPEANSKPPVDAGYLERSATHYLERYSASATMLRRTLLRRVDKRCRLRGVDPAPYSDLVEATVARAMAAGLVDDARFAAARLAILRRRGVSARGLSARLAAKGVDRVLIADTLAAEAAPEDGPGAEEGAALAYAKRRRIGAWRKAEARVAHRARDLAAMARAGFPYALARRVVDGAEPDA